MITLTSVANWQSLKTYPKLDITSTPSGFTISSDKKNIVFQNQGETIVYIGDINVGENRGWAIYPSLGFEFKNTLSGFTVYFATVGEEVSVIAPIEG